MAHRIFGSRFVSRKLKAWHNLGRVFDENDRVSIVDAVGEVTGGVTIEARPLFYTVGEGDTAQSLEARDGNGKPLAAVVRRPTPEDAEWRFFGTVSGNWTVEQFPAYAQALNALSDDFPVETCGLLSEGRTLFLALRGDGHDVGGTDPVENYFVVEISQDPGKAHGILYTPARPALTCVSPTPGTPPVWSPSPPNS